MNDNIFGNKREISLPLRLKILFGSSATQKLFGFFCFFMIFLFFAKTESFVEATFVGSTANGYITNIVQTDNKIKEEVVYAFDYTFLVNDKIYNGTSYSTEKPLNDKITIEYRTKKPTDSYINGMLRKKVRWLDILLASFFPVFMIFVFVFYELKDNLKAIPLLKSGQITYAKIIDTENTSKQYNETDIIKISYEFEDMKGKIYSVFVKSNNPQFIIKGAKEMLFYDANNPKRNVLKNSLATEITLVENNQFKSPRFAQVLPLLILPFIGVVMVLMVIFL